MGLTKNQIGRYSRHLIMPEVGVKGQEKLTESKAFISEIIEGKTIESVIVLGSGMSGFEENYKPLYQLTYS